MALDAGLGQAKDYKDFKDSRDVQHRLLVPGVLLSLKSLPSLPSLLSFR